jgi:hypothetical protein
MVFVGINIICHCTDVIRLHHSGVIISFEAEFTGVVQPFDCDWITVEPFRKNSL